METFKSDASTGTMPNLQIPDEHSIATNPARLPNESQDVAMDQPSIRSKARVFSTLVALYVSRQEHCLRILSTDRPPAVSFRRGPRPDRYVNHDPNDLK